MANYYETDSYKGFLLYPYDHQIIFRQKMGHAFNRPQILCYDYMSHLSSDIYQSNLYFAYKNQQGQIVIRSTIGQTFPFVMKEADSIEYIEPSIFSLGQRLFLLYIEYDKEKNTYSIKLTLPLEEETLAIPFPEAWSVKPNLLYSAGKNGGLLHIQILSKNLFVWITPQCDCIELSSIADLHQAFDAKWKTLEQSNAKLAKQTAQLSELKQTLNNAIKQYNELMQVANSYKEDAKKWHDLYMNSMTF